MVLFSHYRNVKMKIEKSPPPLFQPVYNLDIRTIMYNCKGLFLIILIHVHNLNQGLGIGQFFALPSMVISFICSIVKLYFGAIFSLALWV